MGCGSGWIPYSFEVRIRVLKISSKSIMWVPVYSNPGLIGLPDGLCCVVLVAWSPVMDACCICTCRYVAAMPATTTPSLCCQLMAWFFCHLEEGFLNRVIVCSFSHFAMTYKSWIFITKRQTGKPCCIIHNLVVYSTVNLSFQRNLDLWGRNFGHLDNTAVPMSSDRGPWPPPPPPPPQ